MIRDVLDLDLGWDELSDHADRMARSATTVVAPALDSDGLYSDDLIELAAEVNRGEPDDDPDGQWDAKVDALYRVHATVRDAYDRAVDEWGEQGGYAATVVLEPSEVGQWQTVHNADRVDRPVLPPKGWEGRGSFLLMDTTDVGHLVVEAWDDPAVAEAVAAATADATPEVV